MDNTALSSRHRSKRRGPLTIAERIDIVHRVMIGHEKHSELAREHRVTAAVIGKVVIKAKKNPKFLKALLEKKDEKSQRREAIKEATEELNE